MANNIIELAQEFRRLDRMKKELGQLNPKDEERHAYLRKFLAKALHGEDLPSERRVDLRVPINMRVRYRSEDVFANNYIKNLSSGGVFICTKSPLPLDTRVNLQLVFEDKDIKVDVEGKVVWENAGSEMPTLKQGETTKPGMGVKFTKISNEARDIINDIVHKAIEEHAKVEQARQEEEEKRKESADRVKGLLGKKKR